MLKTCVIHSPISLKHLTGEAHVESPCRYEVIIDALRREGLLTEENEILARATSKKRLFLCHDSYYVSLVEESCSSLSDKNLALLPTGDVVVSKDSFKAACAMVGGALKGVDVILKGVFENGFLVARPPGHHATSNRGMGFCIFNTVAIAAKYILDIGAAQKVAIVDFDVHHCNGTEELVRDDPRIFLYSTHREGGYPRTGDKSSGSVYNRPIAQTSDAREQLLRLYREELPKLIAQFEPQFILISCGFDAHTLDPLGNLFFESEDYGES